MRLGFQECLGLKSSLKLRLHLFHKVLSMIYLKINCIFLPWESKSFLQILHQDIISYFTLNLSCIFFSNSLKYIRIFLNDFAWHCIMVFSNLCPELHSTTQVHILQTTIKPWSFTSVSITPTLPSPEDFVLSWLHFHNYKSFST